MEEIKEVLELAQANWPVLKDILSIVGGSAAVMGAIATVMGIRRRWAEKRLRKKSERGLERIVDRSLARQRAEWFVRLYAAHKDVWATAGLASMTIQQACGKAGWSLPDWATEGWERVLVSDLNQRVKKKV